MKLFKREKYLSKVRGFYHATDIIKVITGVRRCGKSCLMQLIADEILEEDVPAENLYYFNLDKRGYRSIKTDDQLEDLILKKCTAKGTKYLFIDEIQNVKPFEEVINGFRNSGDFSIFITGSNSYLLSGELITKLTGRYIEFEVYPLTFDEYLEMKKFLNKQTNDIREEFDKYIMEGGFPRAIYYDDIQDKLTYVKSIVDEIYNKDIKRRVKIRNFSTFGLVHQYIVNNFGSTTNLRNIQKDLQNNGISITVETISRYIQILIDAKILHECKRFDLKSRQSLSNQKKFYLADLSFYFSQNTDNRINYGPVLENIVYIYAKSLNYSVSVGKFRNFECDFILRGISNDYAYVQCALTILSDPETEEREYRPLEKIKDNYPKYVLTRDWLIQKRNGIIHKNIEELIANSEDFL